MKDLAGKNAFVTGGASGIGLGMAKAFAVEGMRVAIADIRDDHLEQARAEMDEAGLGNRALYLKLDVTDRTAYAAAADEVEAAFGKLHVLCNNAGIGMLTPIGKATTRDWDWAVDVNLNSVFNGVHTWLPRIRAHGEGGHIVNTASMAGILQYSGAGIYVATKFAVVGFSEALRAELAPEGIGVSAFCPGGVRTNIRDYEATRPAHLANEGGEAAPPSPPPGFKFSEEDLKRLGQLTATTDEAGQMVLDGVKRNALYIFTAPEFRPGVEERFAAILKALGEDEERETTALELIPGLVGSPIYRES
jgi:NAD(P)-dependent dehydrogenase (short-subunit alcohol dehydrogenase family)